jgi:hypothetical protein
MLTACPARAADAAKDNSLKWVPDDAAFYATMLRGREQIEAIAKSRAWAKLKSLPFVQMIREKIKEQLEDEDSKLAPLVQWYKAPENRELIALLGDMFGQEVFIYGNEDWAAFTKLAQEIVAAMRFGPALMRLRGQGGDASQGELQARILLQVLSENLAPLKVPDTVIGFKLSKPERAQTQLKRLEALVNKLAQRDPNLKKLFGRQKIGDATFLTVQVDGSMLPWDKIPIKDIEEKEGQFDDVVKKLKQAKLALALGIRDGYLLLSLGETTAPVTRLGQGKPLAGRKELKPLAAFADKRLTSISYVS